MRFKSKQTAISTVHDYYNTFYKENEFSKTLIIMDDDKLVGYINYWILFDHAEINKICVDDEYRRKGYASLLMEKAFEAFKKAECLSISLEVRVSNISAQKLYEKFGFVTVVVKKEYYQNGEDANYMVKGVY